MVTDRARRAGLLAELRYVVLDGPAQTDPAVRNAAATGSALDDPLRSYAAKVRDESYRVVDADIAALRTAGFSEDVIFEVTIAAALGAATRRLDAGLRALEEA